jgi:hypothetical protein
MNGSMGQRFTFGIAHNISSAEEKVDILESERSMDEDLSVLSIRSVSSAVGRTRLPIALARDGLPCVINPYCVCSIASRVWTSRTDRS